MKYAKVFGILLIAGMMFVSCDTEAGMEISDAVRVYSYRDAQSSLGFDKPAFTLFEDGTCSFHFSMISSYAGFGIYEFSGNTLILTMDDGIHEYHFTADGDAYVFDEEKSSEITHFADMPDGARFE